MKTCFLSSIHTFHKNASIKKSKKNTSPKFNRFMPKTSEIALKNEKRTDITAACNAYAITHKKSANDRFFNLFAGTDFF